MVKVETLWYGDKTILGEVDEIEVYESGEVEIKFGNGNGWMTFQVGDEIHLVSKAERCPNCFGYGCDEC